MTSRRFYWTSAAAWALSALAWTLLCYFAPLPRWSAGLGGFAVGWLAVLIVVALAVLRGQRRGSSRS